VLVTAIASLLPDGVPTEIVFIPAGDHRITPQSHPKGIMVKLPDARGDAIASAFNDALQKRMQENVKPWFDFEHTRRFPAAGYPTAFRFEAGRGIIATVEWSASGSKAIEGRDVRYFSPEFYLGKDGVPTGIPERGPLGGLVTEPAFREIPPVAASDAADVSDQPPQTPSMKLILAALGLSLPETDTNAEQHAVTAINALKETAGRVKPVEDERDGLQTKLTAAETTIKGLRTRQGEELFERAVAAGLVEKDNAEEKASYVQASVDGNEFALKLLGDRISASAATELENPLAKPLVTAAGGKKPVAAGKHAFEAKAEALVTAKAAESLDDAFASVAASEPKLYEDYCASLAIKA